MKQFNTGKSNQSLDILVKLNCLNLQIVGGTRKLFAGFAKRCSITCFIKLVL